MYPVVVACYTQKRIRVFAQTHAADAECRLCFRRLKEDGENVGDFYGMNGLFLVGARIARPLQRETFFTSVLWGSEAARGE